MNTYKLINVYDGDCESGPCEPEFNYEPTRAGWMLEALSLAGELLSADDNDSDDPAFDVPIFMLEHDFEVALSLTK